MREIVLDTETTGLDPAEGDRLAELACVELINHLPTGGTFHVYVNPQRDMPPEAFAVHGLSTEFLRDKPVFSNVADGFLEFVQDSPLIIHNASFDMKFLNAELARLGRPAFAADRAIDTLAMSRKKNPGGQHSLDQLCSRYGIDNSRRTKHSALIDAQLLAEVYLELIGGRQPGLVLAEQKREKKVTVVVQAEKVAYGARPEPLAARFSETEREAHEAFVKTLGENAFWKGYEAGEKQK